MKRSSFQDALRLAWILVVVPFATLVRWTSDRTFRVVGVLAAAAVVPLIVPRRARLSISMVLIGLVGTSIQGWLLDDVMSEGARRAVACVSIALLAFGVMRVRRARGAVG